MKEQLASKTDCIVKCSISCGRWLMAPICIGLAAGLAVLFVVFAQELIQLFSGILDLSTNDAILGVFSLIEISLAAGLLSMVTVAAYKSIACCKETSSCATNADDSKGCVFSSLKCRLGGAIIALAGVHLLKVFMDVGRSTESEVKWLVIIYATFVASAVALMLANSFAHKK